MERRASSPVGAKPTFRGCPAHIHAELPAKLTLSGPSTSAKSRDNPTHSAPVQLAPDFQHVIDLLIQVLFPAKRSFKRFLLPDSSAPSKLPIDPMCGRAFDDLQDFGDGHRSIGKCLRHEREMHGIGHDHGCQWVEQSPVASETRIQNDMSSVFQQMPSSMCAECDEQDFAVRLIVR
jgi:hypothetical protein